jgi:hypothetical protein
MVGLNLAFERLEVSRAEAETCSRMLGASRRLAAEMELPYQSLINLYLRDCAASGRRLSMRWQSTKSRAG